ncbi:MAG: CoA transferase, partial [Mycobacteriales bacterium]
LSDRGLDADVDAAVNRGLVVLNKPALGATGPYRDLPGYGSLMEAMGGLSARFGAPDDGARVSRTYYPDLVAGIHGTVALFAALHERKRTGRGAYIDLSQQETTWLQLGEAIVLAAIEGREPDRIGNTEPGAPDATAAPQSLADLYAEGVLSERGLLEELDHPVTGRRPYLQVPVRIDGEPLASTRAAPLFAAQTEEVLSEWCGYDLDRLGELRAAGAIGSVPRQPEARR